MSDSRHSEGSYCFLKLFNPEEEVITILQNVGNNEPNRRASCPRNKESSN
jgi:hypothetical protein